jgi:hypothetical protein
MFTVLSTINFINYFKINGVLYSTVSVLLRSSVVLLCFIFFFVLAADPVSKGLKGANINVYIFGAINRNDTIPCLLIHKP